MLEDDEDVGSAIAASLSIAEFVTEWVSKCDDAIRSAIALKPDVLVFDVDVGGESGVDAFLRLRETYPDVPVVFVTGGSGEAAERALSLPRVSLLHKPFDLDELLRAITSVMR